MTSKQAVRHNNIAISLHWLMAFLIVGMLIMGKLMVSFDETSALRFTLTQWHKTFGVLVLLLTVVRVIWRLTHSSPAHPEGAPAWEHFCSNCSHIALYALLFIAPISGWMLVSVSPLNIDTLLFNVIPWPHIPWLTSMVDPASAEARFHQIHEIATGVLIALLILHIAAALKHHLINKDTVLLRMLPASESKTKRTMAGVLATLVLGSGAAVFAYTSLSASSGTNMQAGNSAVRAIAFVTSEDTDIIFTQSTVTATLNSDSPETSSLLATVTTATATSKNLQVQSSLPDSDWFDSANHPEAVFQSTQIISSAENMFDVIGTLNIKGIEHSHQFELQISEENDQKIATGEFIIDRSDYEVGLKSQSNEDYVGFKVTIAFEFQIN